MFAVKFTWVKFEGILVGNFIKIANAAFPQVFLSSPLFAQQIKVISHASTALCGGGV